MEERQNQEPLGRETLWDRFIGAYPVYLAASAVYAVFYAFCLYRNAKGITYPFFAAGTLLYFCFCIRKSEVTWKKSNYFYMAGILLLGLSIFLSGDWALNCLSKWAMFFLLAVMILGSVYDDSKWHAGKYMAAFFKYLGTVFCCLPDPIRNGSAYLEYRNSSKERKERSRIGKQILLGLAASIPLLAVLILLLGNADAVFANLFENILEYIRPFTVIGVGWKLLCGFFLSFCLAAAAFRKNIDEGCRESRRLDPVSGITVLTLVGLLYLVFCLVQIVYLFCSMGRLPEGMNYYEYAHQGFFSLLAVCVLNLLLVVFCLRLFQKSGLLRALLTLISCCTYIMIASSAYRMYLYVQAYGLTWLRLMVWWALLVITVWMTLVIVTIYRESFPLFKAGLAVVTVLYLCMALARPEAVVARYEMDRFRQSVSEGETRIPDFRYLCSDLGTDAVPVLLEEENWKLLQQFLPEMGYRPEEDVLAQWRAVCTDNGQWETEDLSVRTFNFSVYRAEKAVRHAKTLR